MVRFHNIPTFHESFPLSRSSTGSTSSTFDVALHLYPLIQHEYGYFCELHLLYQQEALKTVISLMLQVIEDHWLAQADDLRAQASAFQEFDPTIRPSGTGTRHALSGGAAVVTQCAVNRAACGSVMDGDEASPSPNTQVF